MLMSKLWFFRRYIALLSFPLAWIAIATCLHSVRAIRILRKINQHLVTKRGADSKSHGHNYGSPAPTRLRILFIITGVYTQGSTKSLESYVFRVLQASPQNNASRDFLVSPRQVFRNRK